MSRLSADAEGATAGRAGGGGRAALAAPRPRAPSRRRRAVILWLLMVYALATAAYVLLPGGLRESSASVGVPMAAMPLWQLALANVGLVVVLYGLLALAGDWLAGRAGLPGALAANTVPTDRALRPMGVGIVAGAAVVLADRLIAAVTSFGGFPHPPFPASLLASITAGIGEEIAFRLFLLSLWAALLTALARRLRRPGLRAAALWIANVLAAAAFAAGHLASVTALWGVSTPAALPAAAVVELAVLNGGLGLVAGRAFIRHGLLAAVSIHFWADVVWHVVFPAFA